MRKILLLSLTMMIVSTQALAQSSDEDAAKAVVESEQNTVLSDFKGLSFSGHAQRALNAVVRVAIYRLKEAGYEQDAALYGGQWESLYSNYLLNARAQDLGDHSPLSKWLAEFYADVESKLGKTAMSWLGLEDIFIFNYALPVALHPRGVNGDSWDKEEYKKHFVPFAAATVYWTGYMVCTGLATPVGSPLCDLAAAAVRSVVKRTIAPSLSDRIYDNANK